LSLEYVIKFLLINNKFHPSLEDTMKGASIHVSQNGARIEIDANFRSPYLAYPSASPVKDPFRQVPLIEFPQRERERERERDVPFLEPSCIHLSKFPLNEPPSRIPSEPPYREMCPSPERSFTYHSGSRAKEPPLQVPITDLSKREMDRVQ
jgi:hypothetical protein